MGYYDDAAAIDSCMRDLDLLDTENQRLRTRIAELEAAELRLRERVAREADAPPQHRYLWCREIVDLLAGRLS